jgi:DNA-binding CsgD family transcriptional regulator
MNDPDPKMTNGEMAHALRMVAAWTSALQGAGDLGRAADLMLGLVPGRYVRLIRSNGQTGEAKRIHASSAAPQRDVGVTSLLSQPQAGCVVIGADAQTVLIVLYHQADQYDTFELGLTQPLNPRQRGLLDLLAVALSEGWARRQPGLITARIVDLARRNGPRKGIAAAAPILDYSNPYALSRSEFRVCTMIGQGLTAKRIARELHLSEATIRSHQRAIYAKTALSGQIEVMFHLQAHPTAQSLLQDMPTMAAC